MKQQQIFTTEQIETLLQEEFQKFSMKWHGVLKMPDLQILAKFIEQVNEKINETPVVKC